MAGRQGVHISYLVVTMVISLGLIVAVVLTNSELQDAQEKLKSEKTARAENENRVREASKKIGTLRELLGGSADEDVDVEAARTMLNEAGGQLAKSLGKQQVEDYTSGGFTSLIADTMEVIKLKSDEATRQVAQADAHLGQYQSVINEKNQLEAAKSEEINQLRDELNKAQAQLESVRNDLTEELTKARQKQSEQADSHADEVQDLKTDIFLKQNKILQLADRIGFLEREINKEQTFAQVTPDGEILRVADAEGFAWINLGRNHRLRRGLVFDVFQYVKGGRKLRKGKVEVARVEDDYAEVRVLESLDRFNPISAGDKIASPFYEQDATPVFVIAGDKMFNERLSREEVVRRIQRFGGQVEDDVRVETTYLVAIDGYQDSSQYKTARELGVTVLRENELLEFIGF